MCLSPAIVVRRWCFAMKRTLHSLWQRLTKRRAEGSSEKADEVGGERSVRASEAAIPSPQQHPRPACIQFCLPENLDESISLSSLHEDTTRDQDREPGRALACVRASAQGTEIRSAHGTTRSADSARSHRGRRGLPCIHAETLELGLLHLPRLHGAEHDVRFDLESNLAIKLTGPGEYGWEGGLEKYLQRLVWCNELFDEAFFVEGLVTLAGEQAERLVITQPWYDADPDRPHPTQDEIDVYMRAKGFHKAYDGAYLHKTKDLAVSDAVPKNFIRTRSGVTHAIDVITLEAVGSKYDRLQDMVNGLPQIPSAVVASLVIRG